MPDRDVQSIKSLFVECLRRDDPQARREFLDEACGDNQAVRNEVLSLLSAHGKPDSFLEHTYDAIAATAAMPAGADMTGERIGPYKLLQRIGEGGFGVVYMAQQTKPVRRKVALKLIKPGMDSKEIIARFEAERQALALMDHPNIARVLDGGTTDEGRPYFVMELVHGVPITEFCDAGRLTAGQRLELFAAVCRAVQHAHQKGIIHRDLKPSNVLITMDDDRPMPRIIDFGVSKALSEQLTEKTLFTAYGQMVGTPMYMSPEQAQFSARDVDTRSDVYSLGVLLYELLTGTTPFDRETLKKSGFDELRRLIREVDPPRPSARVSTLQNKTLLTISDRRRIDAHKLSHTLRGELDWIVMQAMEKDRTRRYESASAFAADVERYLNDEPVQACPPSLRYRVGKYARRHKGLLTTAALVLLTMLGGTALTSWQAIVARREAQRANEAEDEAKTAQAFTEEALALVSTEQERAESNLDLALDALDAVYLDAIGADKLLGVPNAKPAEGDRITSGSTPVQITNLERQLLLRGLSFYEQFAQHNTTTPRAAIQTARAHLRVGLLHAALGDHEASRSALQAAVERFEQLAREDPRNPSILRQLGESRFALANASNWRPDAEDTYRKAIESFSAALEAAPDHARTIILRARVHEALNQSEQALNDYERAVELAPDIAHFQTALARFLRTVQKPRLRNSERALEHAQKAVELAPDSASAHVFLAEVLEISFGDYRQAREHVDAALAIVPSHPGALRESGRIHWKMKEYEAALAAFDAALNRQPSAWAFKDRAAVHIALGQFEAGLADFQSAEELDPNNLYVYEERGGLYLQLHRYEDAIIDLDRAVALAPYRSYTRKIRALALFQVDRFSNALADLRKAVDTNPADGSNLYWIWPGQVAACPDEAFRDGMLDLANRAVREVDTPNVRSGRAMLLTALGQWDSARDDFAAILAHDDSSYYAFYKGALLALEAGNPQFCRELSRMMLERFGESEEPSEMSFTAWTCAQVADALEDYATAIRLARDSLNADPESRQHLVHLGAILMRAGEHREAQETLQAALQAEDSTATSEGNIRYFLAMNEHHLGNTEAAQTQLQAANESAAAELAESPASNRRVTLELLRAEAEALLNLDSSSTVP